MNDLINIKSFGGELYIYNLSSMAFTSNEMLLLALLRYCCSNGRVNTK